MGSKRYGSRGTIKLDKSDNTIANPSEKEQRARNQAMWGTGKMLHEFWNQAKNFNTHHEDKNFKWTDAGGALMGYTEHQVERQREINKQRVDDIYRKEN